MTLLWQGGWTRWSTEVPSDPSDSVILGEKITQTYCNNNLLFLEGVFYLNSSTTKNRGNRMTLPSTKLNPFFCAKGQSRHCFVCSGTGTHCASFCSIDCTQTPISHLEVIINATEVSSTGAASLSYCTDQNPSQNTCRIQAKFNLTFHSALISYSALSNLCSLCKPQQKETKPYSLQLCLWLSKL